VVKTITFERGSKLREIEPDALCGCLDLARFHIPASVEKMTARSLPPSDRCRITIAKRNRYFKKKGTFLIDLKQHHILRYLGKGPVVLIPDEMELIGDDCFRNRESIRFVRFGLMSKLTSIGEWAFAHCTRVQTIALPSSVKFLGERCFLGCRQLQTFAFCPGSEIVRIDDSAFYLCSSLESMHFPPSVEFIGEHCFGECTLLTSLTFSSRSRLRELLSLPPVSGFADIPDSVEVLALMRSRSDCPSATLVFGRDSRLTKIRREHSQWTRPRSFCRFSAGTLKRLRINMEYPTEV
jgi:hypothetical protein